MALDKPATQAKEVARYCRKYWTLILHGAKLQADVINHIRQVFNWLNATPCPAENHFATTAS
jgi:hypothetical protein